MRANVPIVVAILAAVLGFSFAAVSTNDFVQHLDRQVHGLHCSFLPGLDQADVSGATGCHVTLMSPYSSVFRETVWGGVPIALPAMGVFAFLAALGVALIALRRQSDVRAMGFTALAWVLPVLASVVMGYISLETLGAACKLCIGIYVASGVGFVAALAGLFLARTDAQPRAIPVGEADETVRDTPPRPTPVGWGVLGAAFGLGVAFVVAPVAVYAAAAPDFEHYVGSCGALADPSDPHQVLLPVGSQLNPVPVIEVLDPLCPACRGFEARFRASSVNEQASRRLLLFPLDDGCNWMIDRAIHPGACAISEAVLCAEDEAERVIAWAFDHQEAIMAAERADEGGAAAMARAEFPALADCIGSPQVQAQLNQSLRWAVQNELPVLTPQVYVGETRLCDADTDLGMDYALTRLVDRYRSNPSGSRPQAREEAAGLEEERDSFAANPPSEVGASADEERGAPPTEPAQVAEPERREDPAAARGPSEAERPSEPEPAAEVDPAAEAEPADEPAPDVAPSEAAPDPAPDPDPGSRPSSDSELTEER